ncbi:MAG TPA: glycerophosphodiester phosphodiesterase [Stellaceae bacterium]|nr:glycerophosphodiester phosphodiesterase [Stellaceae bacterium]
MTAAAARKPRFPHAPPRVIGHRGAAGIAPENTLAGFRKAAALGVRWVEFDVHLAADGVPVVIHDDDLDRTTTGKGPLAALTSTALSALDAGAWFDAAYQGERVPTLAAVVALLGKLELGAVVEIKPSRGAEAATAEATVRFLLEHWPDHLPPPMVSSFKRAALERAHKAAPGIARALLAQELPEDWQAEVDRLGCAAIHLSHRTLSAASAESVTRAGLPLFAYTVNDAARAAELFRWGVTAVFSDRPDLLAGAAAEAGPV